jgi:aminoglycoside-2''-adenylyltransferase
MSGTKWSIHSSISAWLSDGTGGFRVVIGFRDFGIAAAYRRYHRVVTGSGSGHRDGDEPLDVSRRQLAALDLVARLLEALAIDYWLFGGWAVDLYVGRVTRPHDDIDLAIWLDDHRRIAEILAADGWVHAPADDEDGGTAYKREGVRLELTYLVRNGDGDVFIPLRDGLAPWVKGSFGDDERVLLGVRVRVITLMSLRRMKAWPREDPDDIAKDLGDLELLPSS